jgi:hypothetical protein
MLGERYGWIPPHEGYAPDLLERQPFTAEGMANYVNAAEAWLTNAAADCKGKEGKLTKEYAEQAAAWSIDQS